MEFLDADTPLGPGRFHVQQPEGHPVRGLLVLGHGAGGGVAAPDLAAAGSAALSLGFRVALFEQPWKVAGKRVAPRPPTLDVGWLAALPVLLEVYGSAEGGAVPLVVGGRSAGARVACRTAGQLGAAGVVCLAFPLHLPGSPQKSRGPELVSATGAGVPVLVVQGERDPFGAPAEIEAELTALAAGTDVSGGIGGIGVTVVPVPGDHSLKAQVPVRSAVSDWLSSL